MVKTFGRLCAASNHNHTGSYINSATTDLPRGQCDAVDLNFTSYQCISSEHNILSHYTGDGDC